MLDQAPRRPALAPAILFLAAACHPSAPFVLALGAALLVLAILRRSVRRFDVALLILAIALGAFAGWDTGQRRIRALGDAALSLPIGPPFESSWVGTLAAKPKRIDPRGWLALVDARPERPVRPLARSLRLRLELPTPAAGEGIRLAALRAGDRVRLWARIRIDPEPDGLSTGVFATGTIKSSRLIESLDGPSAFPAYAVQRLRDRAADRLASLYGPSELSFLAAVLLGERTFHDASREARLRASGLAHLLAISGLHVGIVAAILFVLLSRVSRMPWARFVAIGGSLLLFACVVVGAIPVFRAVSALWILLLGEALGRPGDPLNRLACLGIALGIAIPGAVRSAPFALSFSATTGILLALDSDRDRRTRRGPILQSTRMSCAAYLATAPISAMLFGQLAPWAILANLLAFPCLVLVLVAGYASLLCGSIPLLGDAAVTLTRLGLTGIDRIAFIFDGLPWSPLYIARVTPIHGALVLGIGLCGGIVRGSVVRGIARVAFALAIVWIHVGPPPDVARAPRAALLDVGQGQALLWRDPSGTTLVDTAGRGYGRWDPGGQIVRPFLLASGIRRLDRVVLSHGHADHAAGGFAVIEGLEIGELWLGPGWWRDRRLADIAARARERGAAVRLVSAGDACADLRVYAPSRGAARAKGNARSVVLSLGNPPWTLFVPGDLDGPALARFIESASIPTASALVLAHHGSRHGTPDALLDALRPRIAVVSCARRNRFGHPHPTTLRRLGERHVPLWRTDHHGTIRLTAAPDGWKVETQR